MSWGLLACLRKYFAGRYDFVIHYNTNIDVKSILRTKQHNFFNLNMKHILYHYYYLYISLRAMYLSTSGFLVIVSIFNKTWYEEPVGVNIEAYLVQVHVLHIFCIVKETLQLCPWSKASRGRAGVTSRLTKGHFVLSSTEIMTISCWFLLLEIGNWTVLVSQQGGVHTLYLLHCGLQFDDYPFPLSLCNEEMCFKILYGKSRWEEKT